MYAGRDRGLDCLDERLKAILFAFEERYPPKIAG